MSGCLLKWKSARIRYDEKGKKEMLLRPCAWCVCVCECVCVLFVCVCLFWAVDGLGWLSFATRPPPDSLARSSPRTSERNFTPLETGAASDMVITMARNIALIRVAISANWCKEKKESFPMNWVVVWMV